MKSADLKPFNRAAQARIQALFRTCSTELFFSQLATYSPRTVSERAAFSKYTGWALFDSGEYEAGRPHLVTAYRLSEARSPDRAQVLRILATASLRTGHRARSTRLALQGLAEGCGEDPGHSLEAGLTLVLAQAQAFSGNVVHSLQMYDRARSLIDARSPLWVPVLISRAHANLLRGNLLEAQADSRDAREKEGLGELQSYGISELDYLVALEMGEVEQADQIVRGMVATGASNGLFQSFLAHMQAVVLNARGRYEEAEQLLRGILDHAVLGGRNSEVVPGTACTLTETLMGQSRHEEALETSRLAARGGRRINWKTWATALRFRAQCHIALGSKRDAERVLREAAGLHACCQYDPERRRLEEVAGMLRPNSARGADIAWAPRAHAVWRLSLRSGPVLVSCDRQLADAIATAAGTDLPVLIEGETGTGKELAARLIHELSSKSGRPLVVIDCSSVPESLAETELFGAARGAYTGAHAPRAGLIAQADEGTLVLDELPELSNSLQAKLLRVIQEGQYRRIGEDRPREVRARFIAITNQDPTSLVESGALRADLFYRLSGHRLRIPSLRARREDIAPIANEIAKQCGLDGITMAAASLLERHSWPGNIRQLEMVVRLAASLCRRGSLIGQAHLAPHLSGWPNLQPELSPRAEIRGGGLRGNRLAGERAALQRSLSECGGSVTRAARTLGISRQSFYKAMRRAGLQPGDWRR